MTQTDLLSEETTTKPDVNNILCLTIRILKAKCMSDMFPIVRNFISQAVKGLFVMQASMWLPVP